MEKVVKQFPRYMNLDTYAALLFKNGELKKAKEFALTAIRQGEKEKTDVDETKELLEKINSQLNTTTKTKTKK